MLLRLMSDGSPTIETPVPPDRRRWRITLVIVLLTLLIASLAANVAFYSLSKSEYREMKLVRLDPLGLNGAAFPPDLPADTSTGAPLAVFFGDSRAQGWWPPPPQVPGWRFANRGIYGQTTEQAKARYDAQVAPLKPRVVVLQCGINDLTAIGVLPGQRDAIVSDCKRNLRAIIDRATGSGTTVIVTTIFPTSAVPIARRPIWSNLIPAAVREVNADLRSISNPRVILFDAYELLQDADQTRKQYAHDTLHLNPEGYRVLNEQLVKLLDSLPLDAVPTAAPPHRR